jgi:hypothetical protein
MENEPYEAGEVYHVIPVDDFEEHIVSKDCWCLPEQDEERVWIHHEFADGLIREKTT